MRRLFSLLIIIVLTLSSCESKGNIFEYQNGGGVYEGEISYLGEDYSVVITLSAMADGEREKVEIEYVTPESVTGYRVKREGDKYYAVVSDLEIPVTSTSLPQLSYTDALFSLRDENVSSIETDGNGNTVVKADCGDFGAEAEAVFSSDGKPISLALPGVDFTFVFK